jgi:ribosomal protein L11 methyltransferase
LFLKTQALWRISVRTTAEAEDAVTELLQCLLHRSVSSYTDVESGHVTVSAYLSEKPDRQRLGVPLANGLANVKKSGLKIAPARVAFEKLRREDWAESWKRHFQAIEIGSALLIKPGWIRRRPVRGQALVTLDPGLSFGTGQHPTTGFCLKQLVLRRKRDGRQSFLDVGTGSGILAIAATKLGYAPVEALDFDPDSIRIARANARRNRVDDRIRIRKADITKLPRRGRWNFDLICANLTSDLLVSEARHISSRLKSGGILVLAGILKAEFPTVRRAYATAGLELVADRTEKEWRSGTFRLRDSRKNFH